MWDSNAPFQLLQTMPKKLGKEHLEKLQLVLDADKYKNSLVSGFDLCGMYAPFCRECRKTSIYPCALAYINMLRSEGYGIEIDAKPVGIPADQISPVNSVPVEAAMPDGESGKTFSETAVAAAETYELPVEIQPEPAPAETAVADNAGISDNVVAENLRADNGTRKKIRIAVARKKI